MKRVFEAFGFFMVSVPPFAGSSSGPLRHSAVNRSPRFDPLRPRADGKKDGQVQALSLLLHSGEEDSGLTNLCVALFLFFLLSLSVSSFLFLFS